MMDFIRIYRQNASTFYNYRTNAKLGRVQYYSIIATASAIVSILYSSPSNDLYSGLVALQAILVGFSFNLTFYLSSNGFLRLRADDILEDNAEIARLNQLGKEIFHNITYFNVVAIISAGLGITLLLGQAFHPLTCLSGYSKFCGCMASTLMTTGPIIYKVFLGCTCAFAIESFLTFIRMIRRVSSYFNDRLALSESGVIKS